MCDVRAKIGDEIGEVETLVVSRWRDDTNKLRCDYYLSYNKSAPVELEEYARVIKQAYRIEECFHRAKGECGLSSSQLARLASSCCAFDDVLMVLDGGVDVSKKNVLLMTIQRIREYISCMMIDERLQNCTQDEYASYRSTQWIYRTKIAREIA
ncbi:MAG: hypothetical protein LBQ66_14300, partial [Planctomycetaceae bacterium]|nr:hypothetical protein [Planctomycetaceae bacterium]